MKGDGMDMITVPELQEFFFEAMLRGWPAGAKEVSLAELPGSRAIYYEIGDLCLRDWYFVGPQTSSSAGSTVIWFQNEPVWVMQYGGHYPKGAIPFLKEALKTAYQDRIFLGGRGPQLFEQKDSSLSYINMCGSHSFKEFRGREELHGKITRAMVGWHEFWGMALVNL